MCDLGYKRPLKKRVFKTNNHLCRSKVLQNMKHSALLLTCIKLPHGFKTFVLSIFEWPLNPFLHNNAF